MKTCPNCNHEVREDGLCCGWLDCLCDCIRCFDKSVNTVNVISRSDQWW